MTMIPEYFMLLPLVGLSACMAGSQNEAALTNQKPPAEFVSLASVEELNSDWLTGLNDPLLSELVKDAASQNFDVAKATALVRKARAIAEEANGRRFVKGGLNASANRNQLSENGILPVGEVPGFDRVYSLFDAGFDVSYEIDIWNRKGNTVKARLSEMEVAEQTRRATLLTVMAETARTYGQLRSLERQETALSARLGSTKEKLQLAELRNTHGEAPIGEFIKAAGEHNALGTQLPPLQAEIRVAMFKLALLTGRQPADLIDKLEGAGRLPSLPTAILAGLPSDMLKRRPDVAAAAFQLDAQRLRQKVSQADLFPKFFLLGSLGRQGRSGDDLVAGGSGRYSIGPSFSWPIFQMGSVKARIRASDASVDAAASSYEQAILLALNESESALTRYARAVESLDLANKARLRAEQNHQISKQLFESGETDKLTLLDAEIQQAVADQALAVAEGDAFRILISAYKALGGGWPENSFADRNAEQQKD